MAILKLVLQALSPITHAKILRDLLTKFDAEQVLLSVAFMREEGIEAIQTALQPHAANTRIFVGIRNDITSIQAIKRLLKMKVEVYAVDTGSRHVIFHPKMYLVANEKAAGVVIGSANVTFSGLHNNIEISSVVRLDLTAASDGDFVKEVLAAFDELVKVHPKNAFRIKDAKHAEELFDSGRLADETIVPAPSPVSATKGGAPDSVPPMSLFRTSRKKKVAAPAKTKAAPAAPVALSTATKYKIWESKPLSERDLSIPHAPGTNPTGSMGLKKGALEGIDHRHYFRDDVFADLKWVPDGASSKRERAEADFELVIKNVSHGTFKLRLSHKTDMKSATYKQKNFMTQLHWGSAKPLVSKKALLGRILYLYRKDTSPPEFTIEID